MALTVSNSQTLEDLRVSHNDLVDDVGGIGKNLHDAHVANTDHHLEGA